MDPISSSSFLNNPRSDLAPRVEQRFELRTEFLENTGYADHAQKMAQRGEKIIEQLTTREPREILEPLTNPRSDLAPRVEQRFELRTEFLENTGYANHAQKMAQRGEKIIEQLTTREPREILEPLTNPRVTHAIGRALDSRSERPQQVAELPAAVQSYVETTRMNG